MHNKSFSGDGQATVIGGRNVGDEYFDAGQAPWFVDLDVLAIGPVVSDVSRDFDRYWASASSIPAARVLPPATATSITAVAADAARVEHHPDAAAYRERSEEHTSELQSQSNLVCRLLLEKKKNIN